MNTSDPISCPQCGYLLPIPFEETVVKCPQCRSTVRLTPAQARLESSSVELPEEAVSESGLSGDSDRLDVTTRAQIHGLLQSGQRLKAIRLYREQTGAELGQAADVIERIEANLPAMPVSAPSNAKQGGCARLLLSLVLVLILICGGCGAIVQNTAAYTCAIQQIETDSLLAETLGKPVSIYPVTIAPSFSFGSSLDGATSFKAEVFVPVQGPRGWGLLYLNLYDGVASDLYIRATLFTSRGRQALTSGYPPCP